MDFNTFKTEFLSQLKSNSKKCYELVSNNKDLIQENLGENANPEIIRNFINEMNNIIVDKNSSFITIVIDNDKYTNIEKVLKHPNLENVLNEFLNSDVLIKACKVGNSSAAKWLLSMKATPYLQDDDGVSALMYAAIQKFDFVIKPFLYDKRCINLQDNNGDNVLFYCLRDQYFISSDISSSHVSNELIQCSEIEINHSNHKGETILTYCIKNNLYKPITYLLKHSKVDVNIADNEGKTAAMYLIEKGLHKELLELVKSGFYYEYTNLNGESVISTLLDQIYLPSDLQSVFKYNQYLEIMNSFVDFDFDFNFPVDNDENTAFMVILLVNDMITAKFCARNLKKLDLTVKNKYGESVTSLCYKMKYYDLLKFFKGNPTFDYNYRDPLNRNTLLMISAINNPNAMYDLLENDPCIINEVNIYNENSLIIATKVNQIQSIDVLLKYGINVNHQDSLGNTALHYAVKIQDPYLVDKIMSKNPDIHLINNDGQSALDFAYELTEGTIKDLILKILTNSLHKHPNLKTYHQINTPYTEEIEKYLIPFANNKYPDYEPVNEREDMKKKTYIKLNGIEDYLFTMKYLPYLFVVIILIIVYIIFFVINGK